MAFVRTGTLKFLRFGDPIDPVNAAVQELLGMGQLVPTEIFHGE
jgi:hypothetical protein